MDNWYEVGEEVSLVSKSQPNHNGDYVIKEIVRDDFYDIIKQIDENTVAVNLGFTGDLGNDWWGLDSIRKKHKCCGEDYNEMIKSLNIDIVEVV